MGSHTGPTLWRPSNDIAISQRLVHLFNVLIKDSSILVILSIPLIVPACSGIGKSYCVATNILNIVIKTCMLSLFEFVFDAMSI